MEQIKIVSLIEALTNTVIGFGISLIVWFIIQYSGIYDIQTTVEQGFQITFIFTLISVLRGYSLRRMFIRYHIFLTKLFINWK